MDRAMRRKDSFLEEVARQDVIARGRKTRKVVLSSKAEKGLSDLEVGMWQKRPADLDPCLVRLAAENRPCASLHSSSDPYALADPAPSSYLRGRVVVPASMAVAVVEIAVAAAANERDVAVAEVTSMLVQGSGFASELDLAPDSAFAELRKTILLLPIAEPVMHKSFVTMEGEGSVGVGR